MNQDLGNQASAAHLPWGVRMMATIVGGVACGAVVIPALHWLFYGRVDPFQNGWPFCLHASAFMSSLIIARIFRCTIAVAPALYAGLVGLMLMSGQAEYPASSAIGLLIHGFVPAALGTAAAFIVPNYWATDRPPVAANKAAPD